MFQHVSDHKGSIIRELYIVLSCNYSNGSIVSVDMDVVGWIIKGFNNMIRFCYVSESNENLIYI